MQQVRFHTFRSQRCCITHPYCRLRSVQYQRNNAHCHYRTASQSSNQKQDHPLIIRKHFAPDHTNRNSAGLEDLEYEADVNAVVRDGRIRLIDQHFNSCNTNLWVALLDFRHRRHGDVGVVDFWQGLNKRNLDLPTLGRDADSLWTTFLDSAQRQPTLLHVIWRHALKIYQKSSHIWPPLYYHILGPVLRNRPAEADLWQRRFTKVNQYPNKGLFPLIDAAMTSNDSRRMFRFLYGQNRDRKLYDHLIPALCQRDLYKDALNWHEFLLKSKDFPSCLAAVELLWHHIALFGGNHTVKKMSRQLIEAGVPFTVSPTTHVKTKSIITRDTISTMVQNTTDAGSQTVTDSFASRVFATTAFSLDLIISGLTSLGMKDLGPLSMRELALRCKSPQDLTQKLDKLKSNGIHISQATFCKLIQGLATVRNEYMLHEVLNNDMHHEVYDDRETQMELLDKYISANDLAKIHRTLAILTASQEDEAKGLGYAWNLVLQGFIKRRDLMRVDQVLDDMLANEVDIHPRSIAVMFYELRPVRKKEHLPEMSSDTLTNLNFITTSWLRILRAGRDVPAQAWNQVHRLYGMMGRLGEFEDLSIWLASYYSQRFENSMTTHMSPTRSRHNAFTRRSALASKLIHTRSSSAPLRQIFSVQRQMSMVAWGFKSLSMPVPHTSRLTGIAVHLGSRLKPQEHAFRGVMLLQMLKSYGVPVHTGAVRRACLIRLLALYGPGGSYRKENQAAVRENPYSLSELVRIINRVWPGGLIRVSAALLRDENALTRHLLRPFLKYKSIHKGPTIYYTDTTAPKVRASGSLARQRAIDKHVASTSPLSHLPLESVVQRYQFGNNTRPQSRTSRVLAKQRDLAKNAPFKKNGDQTRKPISRSSQASAAKENATPEVVSKWRTPRR